MLEELNKKYIIALDAPTQRKIRGKNFYRDFLKDVDEFLSYFNWDRYVTDIAVSGDKIEVFFPMLQKGPDLDGEAVMFKFVRGIRTFVYTADNYFNNAHQIDSLVQKYNKPKKILKKYLIRF